MLTTIDEAESDLRQESHKNWKLITPTQVKHYKKGTVVAMCLDQSCRQLAYFIPVDTMQKQDVFETALAVARKRDAGFMPVIKCNLDSLPEVTLPLIRILDLNIYIRFKPTGALALQPIGHRNPITYSLGKVRNLQVSAFSAINNYLASPEWETNVTLDTNTGDLILSLVHKGTKQSATVSLKVQDGEVVGSVTFNNSKFRYQSWNFTGSYGLKIMGKVFPSEKEITPTPIIQTKDHHTKLTHTIEVALLVIGIGAVSILTDGAGIGLFTTI